MSTAVAMFDDVDVNLLPANYSVYACYGDGRYANAAAVRSRFPGARVVVIDVRGSYRNGDCLDVEPGDATNADAVAWFRAREGHTSTPKPMLYTSASNVDALHGTMNRAGISRDRYFIWSAHYTGQAHICGSCGYPKADATQWTDKALGRSLDESLIEEYVLAPAGQAHPNIDAARADLQKAARANRGGVLTAIRAALRALRGIK